MTTRQPPWRSGLAHERLSTGALARWMRACASHPWRVVGLGRDHRRADRSRRAVGGSLKDEFEIPGSDTQKATDLIESEFASEQGGVLNLVFAAPRASGSTRPSGRRRSRTPIAKLKTQRVQADRRTRPASRASATRSTRTRSPTTAGSPTPRRSSTASSTTRIATRSSPWRTRSATRSRRPA